MTSFSLEEIYLLLLETECLVIKNEIVFFITNKNYPKKHICYRLSDKNVFDNSKLEIIVIPSKNIPEKGVKIKKDTIILKSGRIKFKAGKNISMSICIEQGKVCVNLD